MSIYFADISALAKRYLNEIGSNWVTTWIEPSANNIIIISELTLVEMRSLLARRIREGSISATNAALLRNGFCFMHRANI